MKKILSVLMALVMLTASVPAVCVSAYDTDLSETGYANHAYLESYANNAVSESGLGCAYTPAETTFKVWSPEADSVKVKLYATGTDAESGAAVIGTHDMTCDADSGIWSLTLSGDHKDRYYTYLIERGGKVSETVDIYAKAVGANGDRAMVCDLCGTDPEGWDSDEHVLFDNPGDAVVWEVNMRDFSIDVSSGVSEENRGKYLAFTEGGTEFCRTKYGDKNSYRTPDVINAIDWTRARSYSNFADYYAGLIAIRRAVSAFGDNTANSISTVSGCTAWQITNSRSGQWNKVTTM